MVEDCQALFVDENEIKLAKTVTLAFDDILLNHGFSPLLQENIELHNEGKVKRSEPSFVQTVFQVGIL